MFSITDIQKESIKDYIRTKFRCITMEEREVYELTALVIDDVITDIEETSDWQNIEDDEIVFGTSESDIKDVDIVNESSQFFLVTVFGEYAFVFGMAHTYRKQRHEVVRCFVGRTPDDFSAFGKQIP